MKSILRFACMMVLIAFLTGCIESTTLMDVNKDGSGTIRVREYYSPQIMSMMEGFQDSMRQMLDAEEEAPAGMFEDQIQTKLMEYGPGVTLESSRDSTNEQGWKGFEAVYAFSDINQIRLGGADISDDEGDALQFTFQFTPGDTATLRIVPVKPVATDAAEEMDPMDEDDFPMAEMPDMGDMDLLGGMEGMFANMFEGMRVRMMVRVDGDVVESNADYPVAGRDNVFTLMDLEFDRFLNDPEAMQLLMAEDPDAIYKLKEKDVPGVRVEDPDKTIVIRFR